MLFFGMNALSEKEVLEKLSVLSGWGLNAQKHLAKEFVFKDFVQNMKFINQVAQLAERLGHHPDFTVHYNKVIFDIFTHSINGLSENDLALAKQIEQLGRSAAAGN
jgi:4a-hydroxytetrahydrobiopterin dehydratase